MSIELQELDCQSLPKRPWRRLFEDERVSKEAAPIYSRRRRRNNILLCILALVLSLSTLLFIANEWQSTPNDVVTLPPSLAPSVLPPWLPPDPHPPTQLPPSPTPPPSFRHYRHRHHHRRRHTSLRIAVIAAAAACTAHPPPSYPQSRLPATAALTAPSPGFVTGFVRHASLNCYADHGAQDLAHNNHADVDYLVVADAGACATACTEVLGCTGFVITLSQVASSTTSSYECYLRSGIILSDCDHAEAFEVHTLIPPPSPPPIPPLPPNPPLPPPRVITADVIQTLFDADGLLVHGFTGAYKSLLMSAHDRANIPLDADCGERCSAFGFLHPELPLGVYGIGLPGWEGGWFTVHRAGEADGWRAVECAAVVDSNSGNRACCACFESEFCPWQGSINWRDSGYCHDACHDYTNASEICKALAAGCGANLRDMSRGDRYRTLPYYDEMAPRLAPVRM